MRADSNLCLSKTSTNESLSNLSCEGLHVFSRPSILDRQPQVFRGSRPSLTEVFRGTRPSLTEPPPQLNGQQTFLSRTPPVRIPAVSPAGTSSIPGLAADILSSFSQEQLESLRQQLTVSLFPQPAPLKVAKQNFDFYKLESSRFFCINTFLI